MCGIFSKVLECISELFEWEFAVVLKFESINMFYFIGGIDPAENTLKAIDCAFEYDAVVAPDFIDVILPYIGFMRGSVELD